MMDRPRRRDHRFVVLHHDVALRVRLAHEVVDAVVGGEVEVEIDLTATVVQVRRHGVPHAAGLQEGAPSRSWRSHPGMMYW
jgi:hypothetical protein